MPPCLVSCLPAIEAQILIKSCNPSIFPCLNMRLGKLVQTVREICLPGITLFWQTIPRRPGNGLNWGFLIMIYIKGGSLLLWIIRITFFFFGVILTKYLSKASSSWDVWLWLLVSKLLIHCQLSPLPWNGERQQWSSAALSTATRRERHRKDLECKVLSSKVCHTDQLIH